MKHTKQNVINKIFELHGNKVKLISDFKNSNSQAEFMCNKGHKWKTVLYSVIRGSGCASCARRKIRTMSVHDFDKRLPDHVTRLGSYVKLTEPLLMKCDKHGKYTAITGTCAIRKLGGCPECSKQNSRTANSGKSHEQYTEDVKRGTKNRIKVLETYINANTKIDHQCSCGAIWKVSPKSMLQNFGCCRKCANIKTDHFRYKTKELTIKNIKFLVQGAEGQALVYLAKLGTNMKNVKVFSSGKVPVFKYKFADKERTYFPDFYNEQTNTIYEVKSSFTLGVTNKQMFLKVKKKAKAVIAAGYKFRLILADINNHHPFIFPPNWLDLTWKQVFDWLKEAYNISGTTPHGKYL